MTPEAAAKQILLRAKSKLSGGTQILFAAIYTIVSLSDLVVPHTYSPHSLFLHALVLLASGALAQIVH